MGSKIYQLYLPAAVTVRARRGGVVHNDANTVSGSVCPDIGVRVPEWRRGEL